MTLLEFFKKVPPSVLAAKMIFKHLIQFYPFSKISDIADTSSGGTPNRGIIEYYNGDIPWIKSGELNDTLITKCDEFITESGLKNSSAKVFPKGTLLVAMYGANIGKTGVLNFDAATNQAVCAIFPKVEVSKEYLFWYFKQQRIDFIAVGKGGAQPNISQTIINNASIVIPTDSIQQQIVDFLDNIESGKGVDNGFFIKEVLKDVERIYNYKKWYVDLSDSFSHQLTLIENLNQAILQEAVQGKLIHNDNSGGNLSNAQLPHGFSLWKTDTDNGFSPSNMNTDLAKANNDNLVPPDKSGGNSQSGDNSKLEGNSESGGNSTLQQNTDLNRNAALAHSNNNNTNGFSQTEETAHQLLARIKAEKQLSNKKEKPLPPIKPEEIPFEIPINWVWCRLGEICEKITDGTHHSPTNTANGDFKYITAKNIKDDGIDLSNVSYVSKDVHLEIFSRCNPSLGDILYIKDGATTGIVTINNLKEEFSLLSSVALLKLPSLLNNKYIMYAMRSPSFYQATRDDMYGVAITRVTLQKINNLLIPLPPLSEQKLIVAEIERQLSKTKQLKEHILANQQATEQLLKALLHQAFEVGEVV